MADLEDEIPIALPLSAAATSLDQETSTSQNVALEVSSPSDRSRIQNAADDSLAERAEDDGSLSPVPILLVTGFLGAGKTTQAQMSPSRRLLNYILTEKHGYRCAVILNEFGESAGIERALLNDSKGEEAFELQDWVELSNGCACCSVKNDFVKALEGLMAKQGQYDYILVETTGLASPGPIAAALWTDTELESAVCLDAIVTVVDASNIGRQLAAEREPGAVNEAQEQVALADIILCNKVDRLSGPAAADEVLSSLRAINGAAPILQTERCRTDLGRILNCGLFRPDSRAVEESLHAGSSTTSPVLENSPTSHTHSSSAAPHSHHHDSQIRTLRLAVAGSVDLERLKAWLDRILWEKEGGADILRLKGLVNLPGGRERKVVQAVQEVYDIHDARPRAEERLGDNEIVLIGRNMDEYLIRQSLLDIVEGC